MTTTDKNLEAAAREEAERICRDNINTFLHRLSDKTEHLARMPALRNAIEVVLLARDRRIAVLEECLDEIARGSCCGTEGCCTDDPCCSSMLAMAGLEGKR